MIPGVIEQDVLIEAPVDVVWRVVTEPAQIARWFSDSAEIDVRRGGQGSLSWKEFGTVHLRVEKIEQPRLFSFRWVYPEGAEPDASNSMLVEFVLTTEGDGTRLRVAERDLRSVDWSEEEKSKYLAEHSRGWAGHLADLRRYVAQDCLVSVRP